jgi:hypothetical protein
VTGPDANPEPELFADPAPADVPPSEPEGRGRGPTLGITLAIGVVVFALVLGVIVVARQPSPQATPTYDDSTRTAFISSCVAGGAETQPTCACAYDKIVATVPYDRYVELNRTIEAGRGSATTSSGSAPAGTRTTATVLPNDLQLLVVGCLAEQSVTVPPTSTPGKTAVPR